MIKFLNSTNWRIENCLIENLMEIRNYCNCYEKEYKTNKNKK